MLERIAAAVCPVTRDLVIEIGPGRGALTELLLQRAMRVEAIEVDPEMVQALAERFGEASQLTVHQRDVLQVDLAQWGPAVLAGNLPYYITSPILDRIFAARAAIGEAVLLVQREVAERMAAPPGSRDYGLLSVRTQVYAEARMVMKVPPGAFSPPPKVDSAVIHLRMRPVEDQSAFLEFVGRSFGHKRKTLRNNLSGYYGKQWIEAQPEAGLRAEQLTIDQFRNLFARV